MFGEGVIGNESGVVEEGIMFGMRVGESITEYNGSFVKKKYSCCK